MLGAQKNVFVKHYFVLLDVLKFGAALRAIQHLKQKRKNSAVYWINLKIIYFMKFCLAYLWTDTERPGYILTRTIKLLKVIFFFQKELKKLAVLGLEEKKNLSNNFVFQRLPYG